MVTCVDHSSVQDKNPVTQVLRYAKPGLQGFCPVPRDHSSILEVMLLLLYPVKSRVPRKHTCGSFIFHWVEPQRGSTQ